jgi:fatty acid desaturase
MPDTYPKLHADNVPDASCARLADPASGKESLYLGLDTRFPDITPERAAELKKKYPHMPEIVDQRAMRRECIVRLPRCVEDWANRNIIADSRDTIMLSTVCNMVVSTGILSCILFMFPSHKVGIPVLLFNTLMWVQRFCLMMHYAEHRPLFHKSVSFLRPLMTWIMAPFYGIPTGMYRVHHIAMHHKENNAYPYDLSSTEPYQRDSALHFLHYLCMYWALVATLPYWAISKQRWNLFAEVAGGLCLWLGLQVTLFQYGYGMFAFYQFMMPFVISSLALMFGNWSQHMFISPIVATTTEGLHSYKYNCALTMNVMNHFDNQVAFNDGYHITHHIKPRCHWTELPLEFLNNLEQYAEHDPIIIDRAGFFDVGFNLVVRAKFDPEGAWKWLIDRFVHLTPEKRSDAEVKALLQSRMLPIPLEKRTKKHVPK